MERVKEIARRTIAAKGLRSLAWDGDDLVDLAAGGRRFTLDGKTRPAQVFYAYRFDGVCVGPGGYEVLYERLGTKALLLRDGWLVRELDRSYYHAHVTPYPVALAARGDRVLLIHAPREYHRLEIEDAETGAPLTARDTQPMAANCLTRRCSAS